MSIGKPIHQNRQCEYEAAQGSRYCKANQEIAALREQLAKAEEEREYLRSRCGEKSDLVRSLQHILQAYKETVFMAGPTLLHALRDGASFDLPKPETLATLLDQNISIRSQLTEARRLLEAAKGVLKNCVGTHEHYDEADEVILGIDAFSTPALSKPVEDKPQICTHDPVKDPNHCWSCQSEENGRAKPSKPKCEAATATPCERCETLATLVREASSIINDVQWVDNGHCIFCYRAKNATSPQAHNCRLARFLAANPPSSTIGEVPATGKEGA